MNPEPVLRWSQQGIILLYLCMSTITSVSPRMEQSKVNPLLGPALKSLYDIEVHLRKSTLEPELRELVKLRVSQINRCAYCIIYHRRDALKIGVAERKIHLLNAWQEASEYSDRERAALAWAEAVTLIWVRHLPDEVYAEAARVFSEQELVDLNLAVMSINSWNRLSIAFRYEPDG
jgi:AhpD family alkylhydroperoxidase